MEKRRQRSWRRRYCRGVPMWLSPIGGWQGERVPYQGAILRSGARNRLEPVFAECTPVDVRHHANRLPVIINTLV